MLRVFRFDVGDADEVLGQATFEVQHREELLIGFHGGDQRFLRHAQELALEAAGDRLRPFVQAVHFLQDAGIDARRAADGTRRRTHQGADTFAALICIDQHLHRAQGVDVVLRLADPDRLGTMEAMTTTHSVRAHTQRRQFHHLIAIQRDQPMHRTGKAIVVIAPAHRLGDRHAAQAVVEDVLQQADRGCTGLDRAGDETLALGVARAIELLPRDAVLLRKALQCRRRLTGGIQTDVEVGTEHFVALLGLLAGDTFHPRGQTARGVERAHAAMGDATFVQTGDNALSKGTGQFRQCLDRQFFGAKFDQQRCVAHHAASCWLATLQPGKPNFSR
ncbi:MAG: hypothetical protein BWZ07_01109 [Alphaproteobacteria bacterium ADurb.BinA280]|nr:MAG: hypothetical protein BWZ07_01109 [Alphaproteobacteria bacterium ADurb.BinA280]